jgi:hypothetical protein
MSFEQFAKIPQKYYIGDGVYASYDGYQIVLEANIPTTDRIALEPSVMRNLNEYWEKIQRILGGEDA